MFDWSSVGDDPPNKQLFGAVNHLETNPYAFPLLTTNVGFFAKHKFLAGRAELNHFLLHVSPANATRPQDTSVHLV